MVDRRGIDRRGLGPTPASYINRLGARDRMGTRLNDTDLEFVVEGSGPGYSRRFFGEGEAETAYPGRPGLPQGHDRG